MIKTGAWKEIQLNFHNFKVIEDLGMKFITEKSKSKKRFVKVECVLCGLHYEGTYELFKNRDKVCTCESRKGKTQVKWCDDTRARILKIRNGMIYRCTNKKLHAFKIYGARGIKVCDEWTNDKESFYKWSLENGYQDTLTIERIDNNKGYYPDNCTWIPLKEQALNLRTRWTQEDTEMIKAMLEKGYSHRKINKITGRCRILIGRTAKNK
jgi:hypothetical protein